MKKWVTKADLRKQVGQLEADVAKRADADAKAAAEKAVAEARKSGREAGVEEGRKASEADAKAAAEKAAAEAASRKAGAADGKAELKKLYLRWAALAAGAVLLTASAFLLGWLVPHRAPASTTTTVVVEPSAAATAATPAAEYLPAGWYPRSSFDGLAYFDGAKWVPIEIVGTVAENGDGYQIEAGQVRLVR